MKEIVVGAIVGLVAALVAGAVQEPAVLDRLSLFASPGAVSKSPGPVSPDARTNSIEAFRRRWRLAIQEGQAAATDERQRLWTRFEHARDTGRAEVS